MAKVSSGNKSKQDSVTFGGTRKKSLLQLLYVQRFLIIMSLPFVIWVIIFRYAPLFGWIVAFQDYKLHLGFFNSPFVGFKHFIAMFKDDLFYRALRNTLGMSVIGISVGFAVPIFFALMLNELKNVRFKKVVQTISYLPHFVSWVIAANLLLLMLSTDGPVNGLLMSIGLVDKPVVFWGIPKAFWFMITAADIWKEMGWNAIIYLAAIAGVDQEMYEAADIDGAGRFKKIWHITIPSIMPVVIVLLILSIGNLISVGMERPFLLGNNLTMEYAEVLDLYILKYGIGMGKFSYATAIGIFRSVVSIILVFSANWISKKADVGGIV